MRYRDGQIVLMVFLLSMVMTQQICGQAPEKKEFDRYYEDLTKLDWYSAVPRRPMLGHPSDSSAAYPGWRPYLRSAEPTIGVAASPPCVLRLFSQLDEPDASIWWITIEFSNLFYIDTQPGSPLYDSKKLDLTSRVGTRFRMGKSVAGSAQEFSTGTEYWSIPFKTDADVKEAKRLTLALGNLCRAKYAQITQGSDLTMPRITPAPADAAKPNRSYWPQQFSDGQAAANGAPATATGSGPASGETKVYSYDQTRGRCDVRPIYYVIAGVVYSADSATGARTNIVTRYIVGDTVFSANSSGGSRSNIRLYYIKNGVVYGNDLARNVPVGLPQRYIVGGKVYSADSQTGQRTNITMRCIDGTEKTD